MILIADSGSTKTEWGSDTATFHTSGINPFHQSDDDIRRIINEELRPQLNESVSSIYFYGAGCTPETSPRLKTLLEAEMNCTAEVQSDMLGAARALLQHQSGIACILGTGANSCYYDGTSIIMNVSPLGYILGDEGSAAYIGKRLVGDILKQQFSPQVCTLFHEETNLTAAEIINRVYRQPMPNRFLGETSQFCQRHRDNHEIRLFLLDCFSQFFQRNIVNYTKSVQSATDICSFVGSIAWVYEDEIREVASRYGYKVGSIMRAPMQGMKQYHGIE